MTGSATSQTDTWGFDRRPAASGSTSHSSPIAIRDGGRTWIEAHPVYVPRSDGSFEVKVKLSGGTKTAAFRTGAPTGQMTLSAGEIRTLRDVLGACLAVGEEQEDGEFVVVRVDQAPAEGSARGAARKLAAALGQPGVAAQLSADDLNADLAAALQGAARVSSLRAAVGELERRLDDGETEEITYQRWCERHSWAFGNAYVARDDVRDIALGDSVDALMESSLNGLRDVIELKRPSMPVLAYDQNHRSWFWSRDTAIAIGQTHRYLDALHEAARAGLRDHPEIVAYHPRAFILIGRSTGWSEAQLRALHGLNSRLHGITVMTYDQLVAQGKATLRMLLREERDKPS